MEGEGLRGRDGEGRGGGLGGGGGSACVCAVLHWVHLPVGCHEHIETILPGHPCQQVTVAGLLQRQGSLEVRRG